MRRLRSDGEPTSAESRVFESSGWLNPHPLAELASENALKPPPAATTVPGLEPYTTYEFRVWAENMAGSISSPWASGRTGESGEGQALNSTFKTPEGKYCLQLKSTALE